MEETTIRITKKTKQKLDTSKIHPRQSYDEIIGISIDTLKGLNMGQISKLTEEYKNGN